MAYLDSDPEVQRVRYEVRRFKQHLITYIAVVGVLFVINVLSGGFWYGHWWFFWVALIWGVFLALQAAHLFGDHIGQNWEDRMVNQVVANRRRQPAANTAPRPAYTPPSPPRPPSSGASATTSAGSPAAGSTPPVPEQAGPEVRQEPIITPPPVPEAKQEPIISPPPGSAPAENPPGPASGVPKAPEI